MAWRTGPPVPHKPLQHPLGGIEGQAAPKPARKWSWSHRHSGATQRGVGASGSAHVQKTRGHARAHPWRQPWQPSCPPSQRDVQCRAACTLYELLGVDAACSPATLRHAFRQQAALWHPDVSQEGTEDEGARRFQALSQAYEVLKDPDTRKRYDEYGLRGLGRGYAQLREYLNEEVSEDAVGGRGENVCAVIGLEWGEAVTGVERVIDVAGVAGTCTACQGSGNAPSVGLGAREHACRVCRGSGDVLRTTWQPSGFKVVQLGECPGCGGSGTQTQAFCQECGGEGRARVTRRVTVRVPGGVDSGRVLRVAGCGHAGKRGGPPGDLLVRFMVHDEPSIERRGSHLFSTVQCCVWQALLGGSVPVRSIRGERLLSVPPGSQHGDVLQLSHAGIAMATSGVVEYGHHYFELKVTLPAGTSLKPREKQLLSELDVAHHLNKSYHK